MSNITKLEISQINPAIANAFLVGVIIAKSDVKCFASRHNQEDGDDGTRGVQTITVRDQSRFINCSIWGSEPFVKSYDISFKIGDVVSIIKPTVTIPNAKNESFSPQTSSPYVLTINEGKGDIVANRRDENLDRSLLSLLHIPIKSNETALRLIDVNVGFQEGQFVDLFVVIRQMFAVKKLPSKADSNLDTERRMRMCIVMDKSSSGMKLNLWNNALIER